MANAAVTFVYNEKINLPIWIKYYGGLFGYNNLFVIDHSSDDGSTDDLGAVNVIRIPREAFDEYAKTNMLESFHRGLTSVYEVVIVADCDEIVVADPAHYKNLSEYIEQNKADYVNGIGVDILHVITEELPLDLTRPILSQRHFGRFNFAECKQLLSRTPTKWLPGLHASNKPPRFDPSLFIFHLKLMDYSISVGRHTINAKIKWSERSLDSNHGAHHRWPISEFLKSGFLIPLDLIHRKEVKEFEFRAEIEHIISSTVLDAQGFHRLPMNVGKMISIPERFGLVL